jgi:NADH-quinone oxidoreductase subunit J
MALAAIAFYVLATVTIASALAVVTARNPVHSVLWLILSFFSAAGLFVLLGAEFLAMLLVVVYVGAVAVLFLFVVMMLDVDFAQLRAGFARYLPLALVVATVLLVEMIIVSSAVAERGAAGRGAVVAATPGLTNAEAIGRVLYTDFVYFFQAAGMILLVAMIGAIVLTLRHRPNVRRQSVSRQTSRLRKDSVEVVKVPTGQGVPE